MDDLSCSICEKRYSQSEHARMCEERHRLSVEQSLEKGVQGRKEIPVRLQTAFGRLLIWIGLRL